MLKFKKIKAENQEAVYVSVLEGHKAMEIDRMSVVLLGFTYLELLLVSCKQWLTFQKI